MKICIKINVTAGWCTDAIESIVAACKEFSIPFIDRNNITLRDISLIGTNIAVIKFDQIVDGVLPESYVFFSTKREPDVVDLPFNILRNCAA
jgi:hypothetical protein